MGASYGCVACAFLFAKAMETFENLLRQLTVGSCDDGKTVTDTTRMDTIARLLENSVYRPVYSGNLCRVYARKEETSCQTLISSHIDAVYSRFFVEQTADGWKGTFDNSATNAVVVDMMLRDALPPHCLVAFTGDEEINSKGAEEVMQWMSGQSIRPAKVLVLDVTNEGYADEAAYAIENDSGFDILSGYRIVSALQEAQVMCTVVTDAEPDESWTYSKGVEGYAPLPCLSLCIPADGELHGAAGVCIRKAAVPLYQQMLATLAAL